VQAFRDRLDLIDLTGPSIEDLETRLSALPERTIVLKSSFQVDGARRRFYGVEIVGPVSAAANRPLFTVFATVRGLGVVGGSLINFEAEGREAGELALRGPIVEVHRGRIWNDPAGGAPLRALLPTLASPAP
jgi:hypothetical protein